MVRRTGGSLKRLPSGKYQVRWYTTDGRHPSRTFTLKADAERFLRATLVDKEREGIDVVARDETLQRIIDSWWASAERSVKPRTADRYREHKRTIERHGIAATPLRNLDYDTVQSFVDDLSAIYAPKTVAGIYGVLNLILGAASKRGKLVRRIEKPTMPRRIKPSLVIPTRDEVEQLCEASDARLTAAVALAGYCGLRQGEILALQREDVHDRWVFIHQARNKSSGAFETTKTGQARRVYTPKRVKDLLTEHLDEYPGATIFPVTASSFDKSWRVARAATSLERVRFHDLRHAAASMMIHAGWNVNQVSKQLGHANAVMTLNVYAHLWPDSFDDALRKMDEYIAHD